MFYEDACYTLIKYVSVVADASSSIGNVRNHYYYRELLAHLGKNENVCKDCGTTNVSNVIIVSLNRN